MTQGLPTSTRPCAAVALRWLAVCAAVLVPAVALATVVNTKHNMSATGRGVASNSEEVCAYCHTPVGVTAASPRWRRASPDVAGLYSTYDSFGRSNLAGAEAVGSVSFVCLSCHDGTQALNVVGNIPGAGPSAAMQIQASEVSLSDGHPVGVPYASMAERGPDGVYVAAPTEFGKANSPSNPREGFRFADSAVIDDVTVWWVETGQPGRQRDDIHLYSRRDAQGVEGAYVECASCHDPHSENPMFLRVTDREGVVCNVCHEV